MELPRYQSRSVTTPSSISPVQAGAGAAAMSEAFAKGLDVTSQVSGMIARAESDAAADAGLAEIRVEAERFRKDPRWEAPEIDGRPTDEVIVEEWQKKQRELSKAGGDVRWRDTRSRFEAAKKQILEGTAIDIGGMAQRVRVERGRAKTLEAADLKASLGDWEGLTKTLDEATTAGLLSSGERQAGRERYASIITDALIDQDPRAVIEALNAEPGASGNAVVNALSAAGRNVALNRAQAEVRRQEAEARAREAERRAMEAARAVGIREAMADATMQFSMGFGLPDNYGDLSAAIASLPDDPVKARLQRQDAVLSTLDKSGFLQMNPSQQNAAIVGLEAQLQQGANPAALEMLKMARSIQSEADRLAKDDPFAFAARRGVVKLPPPSGDPTVDMKARAEAGRQASAYLGRDVPGFTTAELEAVAERYQGASVDERLGLLASFVDSHGEERASTVFAALDKQGYGGMAFAGSLALDSPAAARLVVKGQKALKDGGDAAKALQAKAADFKQDLLPLLGDAYGLGTAPRNTVEQAVLAAYVAQSMEAGDVSGNINPDRLEAAVEAVTGGVVDFRGHRMPAPQRGVDQARFNDWTRALGPADFRGVAGLTPDQAYAQFQRSGRLQAVGPNQLVPVLPSVGGGELFLRREDGNPLTLSYDGRQPVFGSDLADVPARAWR